MIFAIKGNNELAYASFMGAAILSGLIVTPSLQLVNATGVAYIDIRLLLVCIVMAILAVATMGVAGYKMRHHETLRRQLSIFCLYGLLTVIVAEIVTYFVWGEDFLLISFVLIIVMLAYSFVDGMELQENLDSGLWMVSVIAFFLDIVILALEFYRWIVDD
jgi:FtsH-binding integral membrane protein